MQQYQREGGREIEGERKRERERKPVVTHAGNIQLKDSSFRPSKRPHDLNCVTTIPPTFNSIRDLSTPVLPTTISNHRFNVAAPLSDSHHRQHRMSRIEVQRSNSRNKIIAITIAISSRTMKSRKREREREREEGGEEDR